MTKKPGLCLVFLVSDSKLGGATRLRLIINFLKENSKLPGVPGLFRALNKIGETDNFEAKSCLSDFPTLKIK